MSARQATALALIAFRIERALLRRGGAAKSLNSRKLILWPVH